MHGTMNMPVMLKLQMGACRWSCVHIDGGDADAGSQRRYHVSMQIMHSPLTTDAAVM